MHFFQRRTIASSRMKKFTAIIVSRIILLLIPLVFLQANNSAAAKPNIILLLADDLGYETIGANGGTSYQTPVLDQLAAGGMRFTHCYMQPLCTPTRVQLMTGRSNARNYIDFGQMDPKAATFGNIFQTAGYATCVVGKWQLGRNPKLPQVFGFDEHCLWQHTRRPPRYANPGLEINGREKNYNQGEYGPDIVNDYAIDFIVRNKSKPFMLYYPLMLTHAPYQPTPDSKKWNPNAVGESINKADAHFGDMVKYMDKLIGKLVTTLDAEGLRDNTLLIFVGDNGTGNGIRSSMGDRTVIGRKGSTVEAGMHVPLITNWPGRIAKGKVCNDLVDSTDFLPTMCEAMAVPCPATEQLDGRTFWPQLCGQKGLPRDWIYAWYMPHASRKTKATEFAFNDRFKLYSDGTFFDLVKDVDEKVPLRVPALTGDAAAGARSLQQAIDCYKDARPATL